MKSTTHTFYYAFYLSLFAVHFRIHSLTCPAPAACSIEQTFHQYQSHFNDYSDTYRGTVAESASQPQVKEEDAPEVEGIFVSAVELYGPIPSCL